MTRLQLRTMVRRRLGAVGTDVTWLDTELNDLLNESMRLVQNEVLKVDPQHVIYDYTAAIVSGQDLYARPSGLRAETKVAIKVTSGGTYLRVVLVHALDVDRTVAASSTATVAAELSGYEYSRDGGFFRIAPTPAFSLASALKVSGVPSLSMASDTDVPDLEIPLHLGIVYQCHMLAGGEAGDAAKETREDLAKLYSEIPLFYRRSANSPMSFSPELTKDY